MSEETNVHFFKAQIAEKLERYEDLIASLEQMIPFQLEEKENVDQGPSKKKWTENILELYSIGYKSLINQNRDLLNNLKTEEMQQDLREVKEFYKLMVTKEAFQKCFRFLQFLENAE